MDSTLIISRARRGKPQRWTATERQCMDCPGAQLPSVTRPACISTRAPPPCRSRTTRRPRALACRCQLPSTITITFSAAYSHTRTRTRNWTRTCIQHLTNTLRSCGWRAPRWRTPPGRRRPERHAAGCGRGTVGCGWVFSLLCLRCPCFQISCGPDIWLLI